MKFRNHRAEGVEFQQARWMNGVITPTLVVLHDTASHLTKGNVAAYLRDNTVKTSVHFVVERDGTVIQQVPVNRGANHAGASTYHGRKGCNGFSIGVEVVNPGWMSAAGPGKSRAWFGTVFDNAEYGIERVSTPMHGDHWWMPHTEAQIASTLDLLDGLFAYIPTLQDIRAHWYVSPGRKVDVHPLCPLESIRSRALGREEPAEIALEHVSAAVSGEVYAAIHVPGDSLNMRRWPSFNPNVLKAIPHGVEVPVVRRGVFDGRAWTRVVYGGEEGWVVSRYLREAV